MNSKLEQNWDKRAAILGALEALPPRRKASEINRWIKHKGFEWIPATVDPEWRLLTDRGVGQSINMFIEAHMKDVVDTLRVGQDKLHSLRRDVGGGGVLASPAQKEIEK